MTLLAGWGVLEKKNLCNNIYCAASEQPVDVDTKSLYFSLCLYLSSSYLSHVRSVRVCVSIYTHMYIVSIRHCCWCKEPSDYEHVPI